MAWSRNKAPWNSFFYENNDGNDGRYDFPFQLGTHIDGKWWK